MADLIAEGLLGDNHDFNWKFTNDGTLTISGEGVLKLSELPSEWDEELANKDKFLKIVYEEGITEIICSLEYKDLPDPHVLEIPSTVYYIEGRIVSESIVLFIHAKTPPRGDFIDAKIIYVPYDSLDIYKASGLWGNDRVMAMPPIFTNSPIVFMKNTNTLWKWGSFIVYASDGSLVANRPGSNNTNQTELIKKAGDYIVLADGKQQKIRILADYIEPNEQK